MKNTQRTPEAAVARRFTFYINLFFYIVVLGGLYLFVDSASDWIIWPVLGWGLGVAFLGLMAFSDMNFYYRAVEKESQKEKYGK